MHGWDSFDPWGLILPQWFQLDDFFRYFPSLCPLDSTKTKSFDSQAILLECSLAKVEIWMTLSFIHFYDLLPP